MEVFVGLLLALWVLPWLAMLVIEDRETSYRVAQSIRVVTVIILLAAWALICECVPFWDEPLP
jgi:hypothetical protein